MLMLATVASAPMAPAAAEPCSAPVSGDAEPYRVLVVGDSWAAPMARALNEEFAVTPGLEGIRATTHERAECTTGIGGTTARQWNTEYKDRITDALAAYPQVTSVYLSLGMNDLRMFGMPFSWEGVPREAAVALMRQPAGTRASAYFWIGFHISGVVSHVLALRPDVSVVVGSYDYLNMIDPPEDFQPAADYGWPVAEAPRTNPWFWQQLSNWMLTDLEKVKRELAESDGRVFYPYGLGLLQYMEGVPLDETDFSFAEFSYPDWAVRSTGDQSIPAGSAPLPWSGGYPFLPSPAASMADRLHLNASGARVHASWVTGWIYKSRLQ